MLRLLIIAVAILCLISSCQGQKLRGVTQEADSTTGGQRELSGTYEWSHEFAKRGAIGWNFTLIVKDDFLNKEKVQHYDTEVFQSFKVFDDFVNDRTVVAKQDDVCYMAVRGQERHIIFDIYQTLNNGLKHNAFGSGCTVKRAFMNAYSSWVFYDRMHDAIDECVGSCTDGPCPLVLNGHSTAGAAVTISALDPRMKKHNPTVYAFGPIRGVIDEDCPDEALNNIYRIVAANAGYYDAASDSNADLGGRHYGQFFIMDEEDDFYYIGLNNNVVREPKSYNIHGLESYTARIFALAARPASDFPILLSQFASGHWCNFDDECQSGLCDAEAKVCSSGATNTVELRLTGAGCTDGVECASGICKLDRCALDGGLMAEGSTCEQHSDCATGKCTSGFCIAKFFNGSFCAGDWDCVSGSCSGPRSFVALMMRRCADP